MEPYKLLENDFAVFCKLNPEHMVCCSSGTAALHLALECAWDGDGLFCLPPKDREVLIPDFSMIAIPRSVSLAGGKVVIGDIGAKGTVDEFNLCTNTLQCLTNNLSAVISVDTYGRMSNIAGLSTLRNYGAFKESCKIIQDMAEAHGGEIARDLDNIPLADAICWSFYKNKVIGGEEGGAVWFKDIKAANAARMRRSMGFTDKHNYEHIPRGYNYRLSNSLASLVLKNLDNHTYHINYQSRRHLESLFNSQCSWLSTSHRDVPWVYDVQLPHTQNSWQILNNLIMNLRCDNIPVRYGFHPISHQAEYYITEHSKITPNSYHRSQTTFYLSLDNRDWALSKVPAATVFDKIFMIYYTILNMIEH